MACIWTLDIARDLIRDWSARRVEAAVQQEGLAARLEALETFIMQQQPASLEEAERLLDLISMAESQSRSDVASLCGLTGVGRNDIGRGQTRVEVSFAPRAFGPIVGRA